MRNNSGKYISKDLFGYKVGLIEVLESTHKLKENHHDKSIVWKCFCSGCDKFVFLTAKQIGHKNRYSCGCSKHKSPLHIKNTKRGKEHSCYNPNITDEERDTNARLRSRTNIFAKNVFRRDYFRCIICRGNRCKLNAHHLDGWNWCKEKRFDESNGVTLCKYCHKIFHRIYGKGNNTRFQFLEFQRDYASLLRV